MDNSPPDSLGGTLEGLYTTRYSDKYIAEMRKVWHVLVRDFFQSRIAPETTVLDLGAGACLFINEIRARRRIALDANPSFVRYAAPGVETIVTDDMTARIPISTSSIDHVFISNLLEHLPNYHAVLALLKDVRRLLRPGGTVLILQPNFRLTPTRYFDFIDHQMILTDVSLGDALTACGFLLRECRVRFLPFTSFSRLPRHPWLVSIYLRVRPAQWLLGKQTFMVASPRVPLVTTAG